MRADGRRPDELRPVTFERGFLGFAEGSCQVSFGATRVVCAATVEEDLPRWLKGQKRGWVTAEYSMLPRATPERTRRESQAGRPSGRTQEIQRLIGRSLRAVVDLKALGERQVIVDCDVLVADGGTRTAAITGAFVALVDAVGMAPVREHVAAVSVGFVDGVCCLDLPYEEDSRAEVDMNVVMTGAGAFVEVQGTAEGGTFDRAALDEMLDLASSGIAQLVKAQAAALAQ